MANSLTDVVDKLRKSNNGTAKTASRGGDALRALAATVRAAPLRPVTVGDFHSVKQADWDKLSSERTGLVEKLSSAPGTKGVAAAVRIAGIDDMAERRDKIAAHRLVSRALTLLHRGST